MNAWRCGRSDHPDEGCRRLHFGGLNSTPPTSCQITLLDGTHCQSRVFEEVHITPSAPPAPGWPRLRS